MTRDSAQANPTNADAFERMVRGGEVRGIELSIPVASMRSGKDGLDRNMQKALKADLHPLIRFRLARYEASAMADSVAIDGHGALTVAGVEQAIDLRAVAHRAAEGIVLEGSVPLRMSAFGVKPPTMMLGTLRTDDRVVIHYRLVLAVQMAAGRNQEGESR
jgi:polyisoprenoid-binding protein YceI